MMLYRLKGVENKLLKADFEELVKTSRRETYRRSRAAESRSSSISHWCPLSAGDSAAVAVAFAVALAWLRPWRGLQNGTDDAEHTRRRSAKTWQLVCLLIVTRGEELRPIRFRNKRQIRVFEWFDFRCVRNRDFHARAIMKSFIRSAGNSRVTFGRLRRVVVSVRQRRQRQTDEKGRGIQFISFAIDLVKIK